MTAEASEPAARQQGSIEAVQRRTVIVLVASQVAGGLGVSAALAVGALLVANVFGREDLSGFVQSAQVLGSALLAMPAAGLAMRYGRRAGLGVGYGIGALGALTAVIGTQTHVLALLLLGTAMLGGGSTAGLQARYAATDLAPASRRARALSVVVWATTVGSVVGPNLAAPTGSAAADLGIESLAGPFLVSGPVLAIAALIVWTGLRPDPLVLARRISDSDELRVNAHSDRGGGAGRRRGVLKAGWSAIAATPRALFGLVAVVVAHTVMVAVMVMTPVHMTHGGSSVSIIGFVISVHVAGMYALSPIMGWLADRVGRTAVVVGGVALLLAAVSLAGTAHEGHSPGLTVGLFLLGLGWSACVVAGSTILTDAVAVADRPAVQGASDLLMGLAAAGGGAVAGAVVGNAGYGALNVGAGVLLVLPTVLAMIPACRQASNIRSV